MNHRPSYLTSARLYSLSRGLAWTPGVVPLQCPSCVCRGWVSLTLFPSAHCYTEKGSGQMNCFLFPFDSRDRMVVIPSRGLLLLAACSVPSDAELTRLLKPPIHLYWDLLPSSLLGLGAVLSKFSRNRGKAQWLRLKPGGQVSVRTGIMFVSVDLPCSPGCLGTGFKFSGVDPPASVSITIALPGCRV